jgi:hypothetical protein
MFPGPAVLVHPQFDPVALHLGPVGIHWYGLMYVAAFVFFVILGRLHAERRPELGWDKAQIDDLLFYGVLGVIIGGRLGEVLFYQPAHFLANPLEIFAVWKGGMSFHGGFLGVLAALWWFARKTGRSFLQVGDFVAPLVPTGLFFGRIGNFINGERASSPNSSATRIPAFSAACRSACRHAAMGQWLSLPMIADRRLAALQNAALSQIARAGFPAPPVLSLYCAPRGGVAQLGERRVRNAEVGSSILLLSTTIPKSGLAPCPGKHNLVSWQGYTSALSRTNNRCSGFSLPSYARLPDQISI